MADNTIQQVNTGQQGSTAIPAGLPEGSVAIPHPDVIGDFNVTGQTDTTLFGTPKITADSMGQTDPIDLSGAFPEDDDTTASDVAGAKPIVSEIDRKVAEITPTPSEAQTEFDDTLSQFTSLLGDTEGRSQAQLEAEQAQNVPQLSQNLSTVRGQILTTEAEFNALEAKQEGRGTTRGIVLNRQAAIRKQKASELTLLFAKSQALQGQVTSAQSTADRAVELKYEPIETKLNIYERQLNALLPTLNKEETIRAEAQSQLLAEQKEKVADDKARDLQIQNIMLQSAQAGLDNNTLDAISNSKSVEEAIKIANEAGAFKQDTKTGDFTLGKDQIRFDAEGNRIASGSDVAPGQTDPVTGVPTDPSKVIDGYDFTSYATDPNWGNSVGNIFNNIKFNTPQDIDNYIQSVSPNSPVTSQEVQNASEEFGVSWEIITAIMQQESQFGTAGVGARGNNPGNVGNTDSLVAGGDMFAFPNLQSGVNAIAQNIARRRIAGDGGEKITEKDLTNTTADENVKITQVMRLLPTKLKDSEQERIDRQVEVLQGIRQGKDIQELVDEIKGFILEPSVSEENKALAATLRALSAGTGVDLGEVSASINLDKPVKAMTIVENANLADAQGELKEVSDSRGLISNANRVLDLLKDAPVKNLGSFDGRTFKVKKFFGLSDKETQKTQELETAMVNLLNEIRRKSLGTAVTESEVKFLSPLLTDLLDQPAIVKTKLDELKRGTVNVHNEARGTVNLPRVTEEQLLDNNLRLNLYRGEIEESPDGLSDDEAFEKFKQITGQ